MILNVIDFDMNVQDAIDAPRVHHQWQPDRLSLERGISPDTVAILKTRGYDVDYAPGVVLAQVAAIVSDGGWLQGGSDGRSAMGKAAAISRLAWRCTLVVHSGAGDFSHQSPAPSPRSQVPFY